MRVIIALLLISSTAFATNNSKYQWIQYGVNNQLIARATTLDKECPSIKVDGKLFDMHLRITEEDIELKETIKVCEYNVTQAQEVSIENNKLNLPPKQVNRFIVVGDTGCESSVFDPNARHQECDNPKAWPFKAVVNKVIQAKPDFVIHMGDYGYMNKHSSVEDSLKNKKMQWFLFKNEFFNPAKDLLNNVPMIFVRGNHESCSTTGKAWFLFLDSQRYSQECIEQSPTYSLKINDLNFIVFDSSAAKSGIDYPKSQSEDYKKQFKDIANSLKKPAWILIHHPILSLNKLSEKEIFIPKITTPVMRQAFEQDNTKKIPLAISGHFHISAYVERASDNFKQFISGNSGTLIHKATQHIYPYNNGDESGFVGVKYGYTQFDRIGSNLWKATSYAIDGSVLFSSEVSTK